MLKSPIRVVLLFVAILTLYLWTVLGGKTTALVELGQRTAALVEDDERPPVEDDGRPIELFPFKDGNNVVGLPALPWHLVRVNFRFGSEKADNGFSTFRSLCVDFTLNDDVPPNSGVYLCLGSGWMNGQCFYGGLASPLPWGAYRKADLLPVHLGSGLMFSRWGDMDPDAIRPSLGGYCLFSDHEDKHVSCRTPYQWDKGSYSLRFVSMDREEVKGHPHTWVGAFLNVPKIAEDIFIGALRFKGGSLRLEHHLSMFLEVFAKPTSVDSIPRLSVTVQAIKFDNTEATPTSVWAEFEKGAPSLGDATMQDGKLTMSIGEAHPGRKKSYQWLKK